MSVLDVIGVRKDFGDHQVLRGIDLSLAQHDVVVLIGASGSGKSTLLRTINLIERVDDGRILLSGDDITDPTVDQDAVRARIGVASVSGSAPGAITSSIRTRSGEDRAQVAGSSLRRLPTISATSGIAA